MQKYLIVATGIDLPQLSKTQVANIRSCVEQLEKDRRVKAMFGVTGSSTGCAFICEVADWQEAQQIAGLLELSGLPNTQISSLVPSEHLRAGLVEVERIARPEAAPAFAGARAAA